MKNEPAHQVSWSSGSSTMPLPAAQAEDRAAYVGERGTLPLVDAEDAGQLGVPDRRAQVALGELEGHVEDDVTPGVGLEAAVAVAEGAVGVGEGADRAGACGPRPARARWSGRPPGRRRRRSGSGWRRRHRGCPRVPRHPPSPTATARATRSSQLSPAATRTSTPPHAAPSSVSGVTPRVATSTTRAGEAVVGDDQVGAAAQHQDRLTGGVGGGHRLDHLVLGGGAHPAGRGTAEPERGVVPQEHGAGQLRHARLPWACRGPSGPRR